MSQDVQPAPDVGLPETGYGVEVFPDESFYGPPGTGKTTTLMNVIEDEIGGGTDPLNICGSTYRKAMAEEFRQRAEEMVDRDIGEGWYRTTHASCFRLLELSKDDVVGDDDMAAFCDAYGWPYSSAGDTDFSEDSPWVSMSSGDGERTELLLSIYSYARNLGISPRRAWRRQSQSADADVTEADVRQFITEYEEYKSANGLYDFDDMLEAVIEQELAPPVEVLIEDEFQDKTPLQAEVYNTWASQIPTVYVAGDPYQSIYSYSGTNPELMRTAYEGADRSVLLGTSYRLGESVVGPARKVLRRGGHEMPEIDAAGDTTAQRIPWNEYVAMLPETVGEESGHLVRANYLSSAIAAQLSASGIPFESRMATWTDRHLNTYNAVVTISAAVSGLSALERPDFPDLSSGEMGRLIEILPNEHLRMPRDEAAERVSEDGLADPLQIATLEGLTRCVSGNPFDVESYDSGTFLGSGFSSDGIRSRMASAYEGRGDRRIESINHDISTIHGSKGQEWDNVFLHNATTRKIKNDAPIGQESLVWYVGMTRAADELYIVDGHPESNYEPEVLQ